MLKFNTLDIFMNFSLLYLWLNKEYFIISYKLHFSFLYATTPAQKARSAARSSPPRF